MVNMKKKGISKYDYNTSKIKAVFWYREKVHQYFFIWVTIFHIFLTQKCTGKGWCHKCALLFKFSKSYAELWARFRVNTLIWATRNSTLNWCECVCYSVYRVFKLFLQRPKWLKVRQSGVILGGIEKIQN